MQAPANVIVRRVTGEEAVALKGLAGLPTDRPSARAWAASTSVLLIDVPPAVEVSEPVIITFVGADAAKASAGHVIVRIGAQATAQVAMVHEGSATLADNIEIVVGDGATLEFASMEEWAGDAVHLSHHHIRVGRDATLKHTALTFGGDLVRVVGTVSYDGPGGDAELIGLYFADAGQHLEHRLFVDHSVPHCKSRALYKGALQGQKAHTVWIGDVLIRKAAEGTDTYEMNRNLILTSGARADWCRTWRSRPARSSAPGTPAQRDVSTTSSCSTCCRGVFRRRWPSAWWCVASSAKCCCASGFRPFGNGPRKSSSASWRSPGSEQLQ